jgi:Tol biopolymer transport system component
MKHFNLFNITTTLLVVLSLSVLLAGCGGSSSDKVAPTDTSGSGLPSTTQDFGALTTRIIGTAQTPVFSQGSGGGYFTPAGSVMGVAGAAFTDISQSYAARNLGNTKIVFYSIRDGNNEIYVMNTDGTGQTRLTNNATVDWTPSFSPDGTKIAFVSNRDSDYEIYTMNVDGTGQARLTTSVGFDSSPSFSPDGTKIVFYSGRSGSQQIYVMNADGTGLLRLTNHVENDFYPSFSPDGTKIAFVSDRTPHSGDFEIYVMNADGSNQTRLTTSVGTDFYPSFSPDGNKIIFETNRNGNDEIYSMNADGTGIPTNLTNNGASDSSPSFSPDGSKIAFHSYRDGNYEIYSMQADGTGIPTRLTNNVTFDYSPSWSGFRRPKYIGTGGLLGVSCAGFLQGTQRQLNTSIFVFDTVGSTLSGRGAARITANTNVDTGGPSLAFTITTTVGISNMQFINIPESAFPVSITPPAGSSGALVLFDSSNGLVTNVVPYVANRSVTSPKVDGNLVTYTGNFPAVFDAKGKNIAPNGAKSVILDEKTGTLVKFE